MIDISNSNINIPLLHFLDMIDRYNRFKERNKREPQIIYIQRNGNTYVTLERFKDMLQRWQKFKEENGREPNYVTINRESTTFDLFKVVYYQIEKQDTGYTCGPSSLLMMLRELAQSALPQYSEAYVSKLAWTTTSGTTHDGMINAAKKIAEQLGWKLTTKRVNMSDTSWKQLGEWIVDPKVGVVAHVMTAGLPYWGNSDYGHYIFPIGLDLKDKTITIADPARGVPDVYKATFDQFARACRRVTWAPSLLLFIKG